MSVTDAKEISDLDLASLAEQLFVRLQENSLKLVSAESCTGGWVAKLLTDIAGSSVVFDRGWVTYSNAAKRDELAVSTDILARYGAVSREAALAMSAGALANTRANLSVAITGIAGPDGGTVDKPVGTVWFAWGRTLAGTFGGEAEMHCFTGDRDAVRRQAVETALTGLLQRISNIDQ